MINKKVIEKCLKDTVFECNEGNCRDCKYYKDKTWCLVRMQTDKIYKTVKEMNTMRNIDGQTNRAVKEFAKRLRIKAINKYTSNYWAGAMDIILVREIDELLKECKNDRQKANK